jgi:Ca2+-binding RTX toxin-like protein
MKRIGLNLVVAAAVLAAAPGALAGTVSRHGDRFVVKAVAGEDNWYQPSHIARDSTYCPRARHGCLIFHDLNPNPLTDGPGCFVVAATPNIVRCKDPGGSVKVVIKAGDQDDLIAGTHFAQARPNGISSRILLGAGNDGAALGPGDDEIYGGPGNESFAGGGSGLSGYGGNDYVDGGEGDDRLDGGAGKDRVGGGVTDIGIDSMFGGPGIDALDARDGVADGTLDCGGGNDPSARRDPGLDPAPQSC